MLKQTIGVTWSWTNVFAYNYSKFLQQLEQVKRWHKLGANREPECLLLLYLNLFLLLLTFHFPFGI